MSLRREHPSPHSFVLLVPFIYLVGQASGLFGQKVSVAAGVDRNNVICTLVADHQCEVEFRKSEE